ncbi:hypothetical protein ACF1BQ_035720 [Bradyrhizobium sp. RDT10]
MSSLFPTTNALIARFTEIDVTVYRRHPDAPTGRDLLRLGQLDHAHRAAKAKEKPADSTRRARSLPLAV